MSSAPDRPPAPAARVDGVPPIRLLAPEGVVRLTLAAIGDVGVIGTARVRARREGFDAAFREIASALARADIGFANLEMPVGEPGWVRPGRAVEFWHDAEVAGALRRAGVGVVSLANNHIMDCGPRGLARTLEACAAAGLVTIGAGADLAAARAPARLEVRGVRVALLAYAEGRDGRAGEGTPGFAPLEPEVFEADLARWRTEVDVLVVSAHWGSMYVDQPPPRVFRAAHALVQAGADVVLGHHPHVTQGVRRDARSLVLFSLGEGAFNCRAGDFEASAAELRREAGVFTVTVADRHGVDVDGFVLDDDGFPRRADAARVDAQRARFEHMVAGLGAAERAVPAESAARLLRYELEALGHYVRTGRWDRVASLLGSLRPRHAQTLVRALFRRRRET